MRADEVLAVRPTAVFEPYTGLAEPLPPWSVRYVFDPGLEKPGDLRWHALHSVVVARHVDSVEARDVWLALADSLRRALGDSATCWTDTSPSDVVPHGKTWKVKNGGVDILYSTRNPMAAVSSLPPGKVALVLRAYVADAFQDQRTPTPCPFPSP